MRTALLALGIVAAGLLAVWVVVDRRLELPPVGPGVEQICAETMQRTAADLSWVAPNREERVRGREIKTVTLGELPSHAGSLVRVCRSARPHLPSTCPPTTAHRSEIDGPFVFQYGSSGHSELSVTHGARHDCSSIAARDGQLG